MFSLEVEFAPISLAKSTDEAERWCPSAIYNFGILANAFARISISLFLSMCQILCVSFSVVHSFISFALFFAVWIPLLMVWLSAKVNNTGAALNLTAFK